MSSIQADKNGRLSAPDAARGAVIILMLIGHANAPETLTRFIYSFHMPFFFILSGYLFNVEKWQSRGFRALASQRAKTLVVPYFILGAINLIINIPLELKNGVYGTALLQKLMRQAWAIIYCRSLKSTMPNCTPIWFPACLFLAVLAFYGLMMLRRPAVRWALCAVAVVLCSALENLKVFQLPWHADIALLGAAFMYVGWNLRRIRLFERHTDFRLIVLLLIAGICAALLNAKVDLNARHLRNPLLMLCSSISLSILVLQLFMQNKLKLSFLSWLGQNTLLLIGFNYAVNSWVSLVWERISSSPAPAWWLMTVADIVICSLLILVWNRLAQRSAFFRAAIGK